MATKLRIFVIFSGRGRGRGEWEAPERGRGRLVKKMPGGWVYMLENGTICAFGAASLVLQIFFCQIWLIWRQKRNHLSFWRFFPQSFWWSTRTNCEFGFQNPTRTNGEVGFQNPQTAEMLIKQAKSNKITLGLVTGIGLKLAKNDYKTGEKTPKGQMVPISRAHVYMGGVSQQGAEGAWRVSVGNVGGGG